MKRKRGSPSWHSPESLGLVVWKPTEYELLLASLGIDESDRARILRSLKVRHFASRQHNHRYVPEWLLKALGLDVEDEMFSVQQERKAQRYALRKEVYA